tara:strand:- start:1895 stop:2125 length:231 start_codon:yes stop_codon:yes gene_type:complete
MSCPNIPIQTILGTECIGDSLPKINNNFTALSEEVCQVNTDFIAAYNTLVRSLTGLATSSYTTLSTEFQNLASLTI